MNTRRIINVLFLLVFALTACTQHEQTTPTSVQPTMQATLVPTSVPTIAPTLEPEITQEPGYHLEFKSFFGQRLSVGAMDLSMEIAEGGSYTYDEVLNRMHTIYTAIDVACFPDNSDREMYRSSGWGQVVLSSGGGEDPLPETCFDQIEEWGGTVLNGMSASAYNALMQYDIKEDQGDGSVYLFVNEGKILGHWRDGFLDRNENCAKESLEYAGYNSGNIITVSAFDENVWHILSSEGLAGWEFWGPLLPDFCGAGKLVQIFQPNWIEYSTSGDFFGYRFGPDGVKLEVRLHTNAARCSEYPNEFPADVVLVEFLTSSWDFYGTPMPAEQFKYAYVRPGDLLMLSKDWGDTENYVFVTIDPETLRPAFYKSEYPVSFGRLENASSMAILAWSDGIHPAVWVSDAPAVYKLPDGSVFVQKAPTLIE